MYKQQLKEMTYTCIQCENEENPKIPRPQFITNPCLTCVYNAEMLKENNFIQKPKRYA